VKCACFRHDLHNADMRGLCASDHKLQILSGFAKGTHVVETGTAVEMNIVVHLGISR
jgi:hypothetical protein